MFSLWQKPIYRLVILTAVSFLVFLNSIARLNQVGPVPALVLNSLAAIQQGFASSIGWVAGVGSRYVYLVGISERLETVESERDYLLSERNTLIELARENARLRGLVGLKESMGGDLLPSRVIGVADEQTVITIDQGSFRSVEPGQAVISNGGVVGQVWYAGEFTATVLLLSDARSRVPVFVDRSRARGIVSGGGAEELLQVTRVRRTEDVKAGDLLISAGSGLIFPRGLPVARITNVGDPGNELTLPVTAIPAVDVNLLDEVMVVRLRADMAPDSVNNPDQPLPPASGGGDSTPVTGPQPSAGELQSRTTGPSRRNP